MSALKDLFPLLACPRGPDRSALERLLALDGPELFERADAVRRSAVGDGIYLRGIIEISSHCRNRCFYCGLTADNHALERYRLGFEEIVAAAATVASAGIRTVVLQGGEDPGLDPDMIARVVRAIRACHSDMAVTLSLGESTREIYALWRAAGADRYLLKIETADPVVYAALHPGMTLTNRLRCLDDLRGLGYQTGTGIIVGLPGQNDRVLAGDIAFLALGDYDMIGIGPFIPHPGTPLAGAPAGLPDRTLRVIALTRIVAPRANIPATTAIGSVAGKDHRSAALRAGANVLMPNFTPAPYRRQYEIYPGKRCVDEPVGTCAGCAQGMARAAGRFIDHSRGDAVAVASP